jgi:hypothetical protein
MYNCVDESIGCVSGPKNTMVQIYDSKKRPWQVEQLALPTLATSLISSSETEQEVAAAT